MPRYFFDSSAIFKRYYRERGTDWVRALCEPRSRPILYLSQVAQSRLSVLCAKNSAPETFITRLLMHRSTNSSAILCAAAHHVQHVSTISYRSQAVVEYASALCDRFWDVQPHPLRSLDALQLTSALIAAASTMDEVIFVMADRCLEAIAPVAGLRVVNPERP